jgi:hypothetical protein
MTVQPFLDVRTAVLYKLGLDVSDTVRRGLVQTARLIVPRQRATLKPGGFAAPLRG